MDGVCSALPGATLDGMGTYYAQHSEPAAGNGPPSHRVPADPPPEASSCTAEKVLPLPARTQRTAGREP